MSTDIILSQETRTTLRAISKEQFQTRMLPGEISDEHKAYAVVCIGAELGLSPIQSLRSIYVIKGKPVLSAAAIQAIVVRRKDVCEYLMLAESNHEKATYETKRVGDPRCTVLTYTIQQAQRAGLTNNPTWKAHPESMLRARCVAAICRAVYPDLAMGLYEESEGEEIRASEPRVEIERRIVETPVVQIVAATQPIAQLSPTSQPPVEELNPAFAPTSGEILSAYLARVAAATTVAQLQAVATELKEYPPQISEEQKGQLVERYTVRRTALKVEEMIAESQKPGADKKLLSQGALKIPGLTEAQEQQLAAALGGVA